MSLYTAALRFYVEDPLSSSGQLFAAESQQSEHTGNSLVEHMQRKLKAVTAKKKSCEKCKRPAVHWSDLAPHSPISILEAQIRHLNNMEELLQESLQAMSVGTALVAPESSQFLLLGLITSLLQQHASLCARVRLCINSEDDLYRRKKFASLSELNDDNDVYSVRRFSPRRGEKPEEQLVLDALTRSLSDALSPVGRRLRRMIKAVDAWEWEGFSAESIAESLSSFVDETVAELKAMHEKRAQTNQSFTSQDLQTLLPDDVLVAAIEDELYSSNAFTTVWRMLTDCSVDDAILKEMTRCSGMSQEALHVPDMYRTTLKEIVPYAEAIAILKGLPLYRTPTRKLLVVKGAAKRLIAEMKSVAIGNGKRPDQVIVGGDDFVPLFMYVTLQSQIPDLGTQVAFIRYCLPQSLRQGELGYFATTLEFACEFIKNMALSAPPLLLHIPSWIATSDTVFAERWCRSGLVTVLDCEDYLEGARSVALKRLLDDRVAPIRVFFDDAENASSRVAVTLLNVGALLEPQKEILFNVILTASNGVDMREVTTGKGRRVLAPFIVKSIGKEEICNVDPQGEGPVTTEMHVDLLRAERSLLSAATAEAMEAEHWYQQFSDLVATSSLGTQSTIGDKLLSQRLRCGLVIQALLVVFSNFPLEWVDGVVDCSATTSLRLTRGEGWDRCFDTIDGIRRLCSPLVAKLIGLIAALRNLQHLTQLGTISLRLVLDAVAQFQGSNLKACGLIQPTGRADEQTVAAIGCH